MTLSCYRTTFGRGTTRPSPSWCDATWILSIPPHGGGPVKPRWLRTSRKRCSFASRAKPCRCDRNALPGWLYRATCFEVVSAIRSEQRRRQPEAEAVRRVELEADPAEARTVVARSWMRSCAS